MKVTESGKSIKLEISDVLEQNASLKDVMDELEKISNANISTFDIIVVPSLPNAVKEGQVVVISNISCNNIILDYKEPTTMQEGDVFLQYYNRDTELLRSKGDIDVYLNIFKAKQYVNKSLNYVDTYIGKNGVWVGMNETILFEKGIHNSILGNLDTSIGVYKARASIEGNNIKIMYNTASNGSGIAYDNKIDVTPYSKLKITTSFTGADSENYSEVSIGLFKTIDVGYSKATLIAGLKGKTQNTMQEFIIDISNVNGEYYFGVEIYFGLKTILISKISLEY